MIDKNTLKTVKKFKRYGDSYRKYLYNLIAELPTEISVVNAPCNTPEEREKFSVLPPQNGWKNINNGEKWGGDFCYGYFKTEYTVPIECEGKQLLLMQNLSAEESLLFVNGKPCGMFDVCDEKLGNSPRLHCIQPLTENAVCGEHFKIMLEGYAGHPSPGSAPQSDFNNNPDNFYPFNTVRTFKGISIVECDKTVAEFLINHTLVCQFLESYSENTQKFADTINIITQVFKILPQFPWEQNEDFHTGLENAISIMKKLTELKTSEGERRGYIGLIGHSHLDTAWQWPVRETLHKAARTFSNALRVMDFYPNYKFIQSSVVYIDWMKKYYPDIYKGIKKRVADGNWEPNGGAWVEFDNNIPNGEFVIRHFLRGQRYTKENLNYTADCFWEPDTFGYSAALPQILKGCGINYFLTTKLSWNEANKFPHDTYIWRGIDGSEVLTHFNLTHIPADVDSVLLAEKEICHKDVTNMKLLSYGYGDGGGGPSFSMQEYAERIKDLDGLPKTEITSVSDFMHRLEKTVNDPPVFSGELYLELHRGTLTQMHDIKKTNRLLEKSIRQSEFMNVILGKDDDDTLKNAIDTLLLNQFHDILPGTCIEDVHKVAVFQNKRAINELNEERSNIFCKNDRMITLVNSLSWDYSGQTVIEDNGFIPENTVIQRFIDFNGNKKLSFSGISFAPMSVKTIKCGKEKVAECPFQIDGDIITTPFAKIVLKNGEIVSYLDNNGFEAVKNPENPFNSLYFGEDIPTDWDNWDIDYDQKYKMQRIKSSVLTKVISVGSLQLRIRIIRKISEKSSLIQDIVFYSDTPRIDFETITDWQDKHSLLKASFEVNVLSDMARFETQFGNVKRSTHENYGTDKTQFEVCNHKWTDISDTRYGVALLNDCKYGISVKGSDMRLTLHKGGTHPDTRGDSGKHSFTYSLLVHDSAFSSKSVIRPAYELNYPIEAYQGETDTPISSLISTDCENVIIETVKNCEDKDGIIIRLYETEGSHANCDLKTGFIIKNVFITDMLENVKTELTHTKDNITINLKPFEIVTLKFKEQQRREIN